MHCLQSDIAKGSAARVSVRFAPVPHLTCAKASAAGIRSLFAKAIATVLCTFLALLFLTADASAEPDSAYCFDGEGTYYLMGNRNGVSLACREGSDTVTAVTGRLSEVTVCTRFTFREYAPGLYVILPDFGSERYLCSYDYGNRLRLQAVGAAVPSEALWTVVPAGNGVSVINVRTGCFLCTFGFDVKLKDATEVSDEDGRKSALWVPVKTVAYGTTESAPVRELRVAERSVERSVTKSAKVAFAELFEFTWGPLSRAEDFAVTVDNPEVLRVASDGTISVRGAGDGTVTLRHRYSGQVLTAHLQVCNDGIVIVPGFMGSELVNKKGEKIWSESLLAELSNGISLSALSRFTSLSSPARGDGVSAVNNYFGALDMYKGLYRTLVTTFGKDAAVEFFAYDWRRSSAENGAALAAFVEKKGYDRVVLIGHSSGGLVCAQALAQSSWLTDRTALACMISVPVNGAAGIAEAWANDRFGDALGLGAFSSTENAVIRKIIGTFQSIYEMLPSAYAIETLHVVDGCDSYEKFLSACKDQCGSFDISLARSAGKVMESIRKDGVCVLDTVPVAWFGGAGKSTVQTSRYSGGKLSFSASSEGDGIVSLAECVAGTKADKKDAFAVNAGHLWIADDPGITVEIVAKIKELFGTSPNSRTGTCVGVSQSCCAGFHRYR